MVLTNGDVISREIKVKNTLFDANRIYIMYGVKIKYFDFNKTKTIYSPTKEYEKLRRTLVWQKNELNRHPTYLMIGFLLIALAFYLSTILTERAMKNKMDDKKATIGLMIIFFLIGIIMVYSSVDSILDY